MKNFGKKPNNQIAEEAAAWAVRLDGGDLSAQENAALVKWLQESPRHVEELLLTQAMWSASNGLDTAQHISVEDLLLEAEKENVIALAAPPNRANHAEEFREKPRIAKSRMFAGLAMAATVVMALFVTLNGAFNLNGQSNVPFYTTDTGEQRSFTLADGSVIHINTRTSIRIRYSDNERAVDLLQGEALFDVARESERPFRVYLNSGQVEALGTKFNLYRQADNTRVTVVEGRIQVQPKQLAWHKTPNSLLDGALLSIPGETPEDKYNTGILLNAGEETSITAKGEVTEVSLADIDKAVAWRQRLLVFRNEPLSKVVEEFNRYNRTHIQIADTGLAATPMKAALSVDDTESLLKLIQAVDKNVVIERPDETEIIVRR